MSRGLCNRCGLGVALPILGTSLCALAIYAGPSTVVYDVSGRWRRCRPPVRGGSRLRESDGASRRQWSSSRRCEPLRRP
jgi:hypothetical protein